jgi:hypothetical protein
MSIITRDGIFPLPFPFAESGRVSWVQQIHPSGPLNRANRHALERADFVYLLIEDDPLGRNGQSLGPHGFHDFTTKWALRKANFIVVWSGSIPFDCRALSSKLTKYARVGELITLVMTRAEHHNAWLAHALRWRRAGVELLEIRSVDVEAA